MHSQIERLEGLAGHLLDSYLALCERGAMLDPLLFDQTVVDCYASGRRSRGFHVLRNSLFMSCVQDIAKIVSDKGEKTPSLRNFVGALCGQGLVDELRTRYARRVSPLATEETDPDVLEALKCLHAQEEIERQIEFDTHIDALRHWWSQNELSPTVEACRVIRDRVTAHTDVRYVADKYVTIDIASLDLKWGAIKNFTAELRVPIAAIGHVVRCAGFAWEMLDEQLAVTAKAFWQTNKTAA